MLIVAAAALFREDGCVLIQQRRHDRQHGGLWEFPGGKLEPGESAAAALRRELAEELGITVIEADCHPAGFTVTDLDAPTNLGHTQLLMLLYRLDRWHGRIAMLDAAALAWVQPDRLHDYPMPPADVPLIDQLARAVPHDRRTAE